MDGAGRAGVHEIVQQVYRGADMTNEELRAENERLRAVIEENIAVMGMGLKACQERDALRKVVGELVAALKPFAWCGEKVYPNAGDRTQFELAFPPDIGMPDVKAWRDATAALASASPLLEGKG